MATGLHRALVAPLRVDSLPPAVDRRFEAVMFDWDGTAVPDRSADASRIRGLIEDLCALGMEVAVVSGTNVANVDGQLGARPRGPGRLVVCSNRGSEVFRVTERGPRRVFLRRASADEEAALTTAAALTQAWLAERGLHVEIVSARLNRRKIDLIPEPAWADPPKARIEELLSAVEGRLREAGIAGLAEVVRIATSCATEAGLPDARITSDVKHMEIGLTDKSDSARWVFGTLWRRGIGPGLVLVAGDEFGSLGGIPGSDSFMLVPEASRATVLSVGAEPTRPPREVVHLPGGPDAFLAVLEDQLRRREGAAVPDLDLDPAWGLTVEGVDPTQERIRETLLTLADGRIGTRGSPLGAHPAAMAGVLMAGTYRGDGPDVELLPCPVWTRLPLDLRERRRVIRELDLRTGLLGERVDGPADAVRSVRFSSLARPGITVLRAEGDRRALSWGTPLVEPEDAPAETGGDGAVWVAVRGRAGGAVTAASESRVAVGPDGCRLERLAAYLRDAPTRPAPRRALRRLRRAGEAGFERLLTEHRTAWARRWEEAGIVLEGDPELQKAVRFAQFHLMASVADRGEAAVGARGLSGPAYRGHVFWDSDVFVLPFLAATHPPAARAMLEYRVRRLPQARAAAAAAGRRGARFPWESADSGFDVTPRTARDRTGRVRAIRTGLLQEHIVADVAWAADCYVDWTGDERFAAGPGLELLVETARYWASRIRVDRRGRGHILGVIGPDEYHEPVDDNAFTNVMARWNLRRAAQAVGEQGGAVDADERTSWLHLADVLVDGYDPSTGLYEQFAGYFELEPLIIADISRRPIAADLLLGPERVEASQVVKQPDVLMLHHMVPGEVTAGSLRPNLDFYEPRTAHGSSLSPGVHAALLARVGRLEEAVEWLRLTSRIDLDDLTETTAGGLHLASMGSVWQALAFGFAGLAPRGTVLEVDPRLPSGWERLEVPVMFRGARIRVMVRASGLRIEADREVTVSVSRGPPVTIGSEGLDVALSGHQEGGAQR